MLAEELTEARRLLHERRGHEEVMASRAQSAAGLPNAPARPPLVPAGPPRDVVSAPSVGLHGAAYGGFGQQLGGPTATAPANLGGAPPPAAAGREQLAATLHERRSSGQRSMQHLFLDSLEDSASDVQD